MAHEHSAAEGAPRETFWRRKAAVADEMALIVHDVGIAIHHGWQLLAIALCRSNDFGERRGLVEHVARIEKHDIVSRGHVDGLVHGVVKPLVGLADAIDFVGHGSNAVALLIMMDELQRIIGGIAVHNHVFHVWIILRFNRSDGFVDKCRRVVGDSRDGYFQRRFRHLII